RQLLGARECSEIKAHRFDLSALASEPTWPAVAEEDASSGQRASLIPPMLLELCQRGRQGPDTQASFVSEEGLRRQGLRELFASLVRSWRFWPVNARRN